MDSTSRLAARVAVALLVFAAAFATRSFYVEDLIRAERASRKRAGFHDALANATQKFTYDYEQRALRILRGGGVLYTGEQPPRELEIAHPPGYAVFMAAVYAVAPRRLKSVTVAQTWLDALCAALVAYVVGVWWGTAAGAIGGLLIALSPHLAWNCMIPMPDTACAWPILGGVVLVRSAVGTGRWALYVAGGLLLGLACWLRANALLIAPLAALLAWRLRPAHGPWRPTAILLAAWLVITPITLRNWIVYDAFLPLGWGAGRTLIEGIADYDFENRFGFPKFDKELTRWDEEADIRSHLQRETLLERKALAVILHHPFWFASVVIRRALFQWSYDTSAEGLLDTPFQSRIQPPVGAEGSLPLVRTMVRSLQRIWSTPLFRALCLLGVFWLWATGRRQDLAVFLLVPLYYLVFQSLLHTEYRYCLPVHYFLFPVMGFGIAATAAWLRRRRAA